jgi:hypothetical protein
VVEAQDGMKAEALNDFAKAFKIDPSLRARLKDFIEKKLQTDIP